MRLRAFAALVGLARAFRASPRPRTLNPLVSPDRIDDVPSTRVDPYPTFDNFAWRAFIALNWPALVDADASRRARSREDPRRSRSARVGDVQVPLRTVPGRARRQADRALSLGELRRAQPLRGRLRQPREDARLLHSLCRVQPARLHAGRVPQSAGGAEPDLYALRDPGQRARIRRHRRRRLERGTQPAGRGPSGGPADRVDRDQGVVAPDDGSGHAGGACALLRRQGRRSRRRRQEPRGRSDRLLEEPTSGSSASTSWSRHATGRSGCGAPSSMSTMCRRPARAKRASPTPGTPARPIPSSTPPSRIARLPLLGSPETPADQREQSAEARSRADAGHAPPSRPPVDHGDEPGLLGSARNQGHGLGALHAGRQPVADHARRRPGRRTTDASFPG